MKSSPSKIVDSNSLNNTDQDKEYEPTSGKKLIRLYQKVFNKIFVKKASDYSLRNERAQEIFQKLSRILTVNEIDPETYLTVQMTTLHDSLVKRGTKFHPNMLTSKKALNRFWEVVLKTQEHGQTASVDSIESLAGYQELYEDLVISEHLFGNNLTTTRLAGNKFSVDDFILGDIGFLGENWLIHFREEIRLDDYIEHFSESRLELVDQILSYKDSESYCSNLMENLMKARSSATIWVIKRWVPSLDEVDADRKVLELDPLSYWWSVSNFIIDRIHEQPEEVKSKILSCAPTKKKIPKELGQSWSEHIES